jgi:hypothetical protein
MRGVAFWEQPNHMRNSISAALAAHGKKKTLVRATAALSLVVGVFTTTPAQANGQRYTDLYILQYGELYRANEGTGVPTQVGPSNAWLGATSIVDAGGAGAYVIQGDALWHVSLQRNSTEGNYSLVSNLDWSGPTKLAYGFLPQPWPALGTGLIVAWQNDHLYRVDTTTQVTTQLGAEAWVGLTAMAYLNYNNNSDGDDLFAVQADALWRTNVNTGAYTRVGPAGAWANTVAMTHDDSSLYMAQSGHLWRTSPSNGAYTDLGGGWNFVTTMTMLAGFLYVINDGDLYAVDPTNGQYTLLGEADDWAGDTLMTFRDFWIPG